MDREKLIITLTTTPDKGTAKRLALALLESRLCACVNIIPQIESLYWWQGKIEESVEYLLVIKSRSSQDSAVRELICKEHPYDTPEVIALESDSVDEKYLRWIMSEARR